MPATSDSSTAKQINTALQSVTCHLLEHRGDTAWWVGELSSSALATATAISALSQYRKNSLWPSIKRPVMDSMINKGCRWLLEQQNSDGGWGDTDQSLSNVATSMLVVAAMTLANKLNLPEYKSSIENANNYIDQMGRVDALRKRYGKDKTFAVPILANCAIAGLVSWSEVSALPFEAAVVPQKFYRFVKMPVVSYAIPALVAIGQVKFMKDPPWNPISRLIRKYSVSKGMKVLHSMQPKSGGFLEAIPLTCFVAMSLAHSDRADHEVTKLCMRFVEESFRDFGETGTWPIDTNLATWNTTLAVNAISDLTDCHLTEPLLDWIMKCQYKTVHPFTGSQPGGWGWSDLSGAVPDADDTPGALLAIRKWYDHKETSSLTRDEILTAARNGVDWLLALQNRDRGWPTFCKGWGRLPFDRSGNDLTAHAIRALMVWSSELDGSLNEKSRLEKAVSAGFQFLKKNQHADGYWLPLWFGNQDDAREENPVYGTCKVLAAWLERGISNDQSVNKAIHWLVQSQNKDGGWGGGPSNGANSSMQESSLALEILALLALEPAYECSFGIHEVLERGSKWLLQALEDGKLDEKWPIGFYFAKLWYYEALYPTLFCTSALRVLNRYFSSNQTNADN